MQPPALDDRLTTAASLFPACDTGADIGADHGRLSCYLLETGKCARMLVTDIGESPLDKARALIARHGLTDRARFLLGDGFQALTEPAQAAAVLGMGGETIERILLNGRPLLRGAALVLSPQTELMRVRAAVAAIGYHLDEEKIARAQGRFYVVLRAVPGDAAYTERELLLGPCLSRGCEKHYPAFVRWRRDVTARDRSEDAQRHLIWLEEECERVCADG